MLKIGNQKAGRSHIYIHIYKDFLSMEISEMISLYNQRKKKARSPIHQIATNCEGNALHSLLLHQTFHLASPILPSFSSNLTPTKNLMLTCNSQGKKHCNIDSNQQLNGNKKAFAKLLIPASDHKRHTHCTREDCFCGRRESIGHTEP